MNLILNPFISVGPISLGMRRSTVRAELQKEVSLEEMEVEESQFRDYFDELDISIDYQRGYPHGCHIIGIYPSNKLILEGKNLMNSSLLDLKKWLENREESFEIYTEGISVLSLGLLFDTDDYEEYRMDNPTKITVFSRGHDLSKCLGTPKYKFSGS